MSDNKKIITQLERLNEHLDRLLPQKAETASEFNAFAYRWRKSQHGGYIQAVNHPAAINLGDLQCIAHQKREIIRNTRQFLRGYPANNVLLWGPRGTGKSSLIKAVMNDYQSQGLKVIEVKKQYVTDLPDIIDQLDGQDAHFMLFCDDLSFEAVDTSYKQMKAVLDGSIQGIPENILIYATSNRRHLMPEYMDNNLQSKYIGEELHFSEAIEEKISLSERFGLWLAFHPFTQEQYLVTVKYWQNKLGAAQYDETVRMAALKWALERGSRSGRSAWQFARNWVGQQQLDADDS